MTRSTKRPTLPGPKRGRGELVVLTAPPVWGAGSQKETLSRPARGHIFHVCVICVTLWGRSLYRFPPFAFTRRIHALITPAFRMGKPIPRWFRWREETYELCRLIETWTKQSEWWRHTGPKRRVYDRVEVRGPHPTDVWSRFTCTIVYQTYGESETWRMATVDD